MFETKLNRGATNGYAPLGGDKIVPASYLPIPINVLLLSGTSIYSTSTSGFSGVFAFLAGSSVALSATSIDYSVFIGQNAGALAINASGSTFLGGGAGFQATGAANSNFFGLGAGSGATGANNSNFLGQSAGSQASGTTQSNFIGGAAGFQATNLQYSTFIGNSAGAYAQGSSYSNFIGQNAGTAAAFATYANFFGYDAGYGASGASGSNFFGNSAGFFATGSTSSNFFGTSAGYLATNAFDANFFGSYAGFQSTNASGSVFMGNSAGYNSPNANGSMFIGVNAGAGITGFPANFYFSSLFIGPNAGTNATNANDSVFIGNSAGFGAVSASNSTLIGLSVGSNISFSGTGIGANNIIIGTNISLPDSTANSFNIGGVLFGTGSYSSTTGSVSLSAQTGGSVGIGVVVSAITNTLHVSAVANPVRIQGMTASTGDTNVISIDTNGVLHSYALNKINAATGGTYLGSTILFSGTGTLGSITGINTLYNSDSLLLANRTVNLSSFTLTFSSTTQQNALVISGGSVGIGLTGATNKLHISATTHPLRIQGMSATTADTTVMSVDNNGVVHTTAISSLFPSGQATLVAGAKLVSVSGITSSSKAFVSMGTATTSNNSTSWQGNCSANTLTLRANISGGTINVADTSTLNWFIIV